MKKYRVSVQLRYEIAVTVFAVDEKQAIRFAKEQDYDAFSSGKRIKVTEVTENE